MAKEKKKPKWGKFVMVNLSDETIVKIQEDLKSKQMSSLVLAYAQEFLSSGFSLQFEVWDEKAQAKCYFEHEGYKYGISSFGSNFGMAMVSLYHKVYTQLEGKPDRMVLEIPSGTGDEFG